MHTGKEGPPERGPRRARRPLSQRKFVSFEDARYTGVEDLSALHELTSLRRIFVQNTPVDADQIASLREALPALEVCDYTDYWRGVGRPGTFWREPDC